MKQLVLDFPLQLQEALIIGKNHRFITQPRQFSNIVVTGLGGSGIGGSIVQNYVFDKLNVPFVVNKDYSLPAFVGKDTLVIACSYSGNTEETLMALQQAKKKRATIICVTSGGKVAEFAGAKKLDCILVPAGMPPRSCLGYSLVQLLSILNHFGLIPGNFDREIKAAIKLLKTNSADIQKKASVLAKKMFGKLPIIYSAAALEGVAVRFRQQINENSKLLAWHGAIPEMNHNELVGWRDDASDKVVIILRDQDDFSRVQARMEIGKKIAKKYNPTILEIYSEGKTYWERVFYLIHLTDWVSVFLADLRGVDATEVRVIDYLKGELAKVK
ncbi:bifunctional phosphoglucose/phosphomannose isomerase [Nemorincola caseinilytica]|uniref:Bifunctional phosphoglucose/phosphomannose isomerase n=1 Tax=Nemorincola caseinilytica TaxID=2054315 RepID=A0ABP8NQW3_9BACT